MSSCKGKCENYRGSKSPGGSYYDLINHFRNQALEVGFELMARGYYELIPFKKWTSKDPDTGFVKPMPGTMDFIILKKPINERLF